MKRTIIVSTSALLLVVVGSVAYFVGKDEGYVDGQKYCAEHLHQSREYWDSVTELDKSFMPTIVSQPNIMKSGRYVFESKYHCEPAQTNMIDLVLVDGLLKTIPTSPQDSHVSLKLEQDGNVISWRQSRGEEDGQDSYVGVIDGNEIWGRVYMPRINGWHMNPPAIGVWRIYPKPDELEL